MTTNNQMLFYRLGINQTIDEMKLYFGITDSEISEKFVCIDKPECGDGLLEIKLRVIEEEIEYAGAV